MWKHTGVHKRTGRSVAPSFEHNVQFTLIGVDEGCQFEWEQLEYMMSRLRSNSRHPSRMVISCNPDPDHKICEMIAWYLDDDGYPIKERDGVKRYFIAIDGDLVWSDTREELMARYELEEDDVLSFSFISATIEDNPIMLKNNRSYLAYLNGLNPTEKARLRYGNWYARPEGANYFKREWLIESPRIPDKALCVRAWDLAGSDRSTDNKNPDFTACIKMYKTRSDEYYLVGDFHKNNYDEVTETFGRFCKKAGTRDNIMVSQAKYDGDDCYVVLPVDPGSAGKSAFRELSKRFTSEGIIVKQDPTPNNKSKLVRFTPFAASAENGNVFIVKDTFDKKTYEALMKELESFSGERSTTSRKDD